MVVVNIIGGLGNQMFQYAFGYAVSRELKTDLVLDLSDFTGYSLHNGFELVKVFGIEAEAAKNKQLRKVFGFGWKNKKRIILSDRFRLYKLYSSIYKEKSHSFNSEVFDLKGSMFFHGYWQTEKYFLKYEDEIRRQFSFLGMLDSNNQVIADEVVKKNTVSLHVRRGDYVSNTKNHSVHGCCSLSYYQDAIDYIVSNVRAPIFYVFSDDISWVRDNLKISFEVIYVDINSGENSYRDMQLMSMCKHHIIANSSFSWWGAWLGGNKSKIVVSPKQWFVNEGMNCLDVIPEGWVRL
ncbi:MAG: alpha-1,2-fucosyltransferase [Bacteroidota bacterium]